MRSCTGRKRDEPISHHQLKYAHAPFGRPDARRGIGDPQKALSTTVPLLARTGTSKSIVRFDILNRVAARFCPADVPTYTASHAPAAPVMKRRASAAFDRHLEELATFRRGL